MSWESWPYGFSQLNGFTCYGKISNYIDIISHKNLVENCFVTHLTLFHNIIKNNKDLT